jgi:GTP-binding protein
MQINKIDFIGSFKNIQQAPVDKRPQYAFIGRSNVGKSSLINMLVNRTHLARTSSTPGKTQSLNYFLVDDIWYLVDLPGYGYAKVSKKERKSWGTMIKDYLRHSETLLCTFVLIDSRIPAQQIDIAFTNWLGEQGVPFVFVFTKVDKLNSTTRNSRLAELRKKFSENWTELPQQFECSSITKEGRDEVLSFIEQINDQYKQ